jgi:hypothetical protein
MSLSALTYTKLPDVPPSADQGVYNFLMQLKRVLKKMSGENLSSERILTFGDLLTLGLSTTRWDDLRFPAVGQQVDTSSGRLDYDYINCGINFAVNARYSEEPLCHVVQIPHNKQFGTALKPHIHWEQNSADTPNWLLEWRWVNNGELRGTYQLSAHSSNVFPYVSGNLQQITTFPEIPAPVRESVSSILDVKLYRDSANTSTLFSGSDTYSGPALLKEFDIHYQIDSFGSTEEYSK